MINPLEFRNLVNLEEVVIPLSAEKIPYSAFSGCASLSDVYYAGSVKDWKKVSVEGSNETLE